MKPIVRSVFLALSLTLAGCATQMSRTAPPVVSPAAEQAERERIGALSRRQTWTFEGRVAVSKAGKGGNGRIDWNQQGRDYIVSLSAPVTRQSWRLIGNTHDEAGTLEGLEGGTRQGENAEALLQEATGWEIPVNALAEWVRGLVAEGYPVESIQYGVDGRPASLQQAGWTIRYSAWHDAEADRPALPQRIEAVRDDAKVRLVVDRWALAAP